MVNCKSLAPALLALALLGGCGSADSGEVYPLPATEVRELLRATDLPPVFGSAPVRANAIHDGDGNIIWWVTQRGEAVLRFIAHTETVDASHTRVTVDIQPPTDAVDDPMAKRLADNPSIRNLYRAAMVEQVDAALEHREFNYSAISGQMMGAMAANMGEIGDRMDRAAEASRKADEANMADAYAREGQSSYSDEDETEFGKPMDDADPGTY